MVSTNFSDHFFVTLDTPMGSDIISVHPTFGFIGGFLSELVAQIGSHTSNCYKSSLDGDSKVGFRKSIKVTIALFKISRL